MVDLNVIKDISEKTPSRIVMLVMDGLGGVPHPNTGRTELETARKPNLDRIAAASICGLMDPVSPGITPGSGPGHLSLFGYDPVKYLVGRGVLEALGVDFELRDGDVAARCNYCAVDEKGIITDRRAGRIATEKSAELCQRLAAIRIKGVEIFILPGKEHRFAVVFRGEGLGGEVDDTDPQKTGMAPRTAVALSAESRKTASVINEFIDRAKAALADSRPANMILFRGISQRPKLPTMAAVFKLDAAAIATYPMYRGLSRLVGMKILNTGNTFGDELGTLTENWTKHDFFYVHIKKTDAAGEDGNFDLKVQAIEEADALLPKLLDLKPDVLVITGDHSTPAVMKGHSWHPVPVLIYSPYCRTDLVREFTEKACATGGLGRIHGTDILPLAMANALKLSKYGA